jgi:ABC-type polysaccharide/polyol phosphate export permease
MIHLLRAFFWLEAHLARQHRSALVSQFLQFFVFLLIFARLPIENRQDFFDGVPYIHFVLMGLVYQVFYEAVMNGPTSRLSELQLTGQLQIVLSAPFPRWMILLAAGAVSSLSGAVRALVILAAGALLFGLDLKVVSWGALSISVVYTVALGTCLALLNIAGALIWPRLNLTSFFSSLLLGVLSGVFIPIDRLPRICQPIAKLNPLRWGLDLFRHAFAQHAEVSVTSSVAAFVALLILAALAAFAFQRADHILTRDNRYQYF